MGAPGIDRPTHAPCSLPDASERALGVRPVPIRSGGSLPILGALAHKCIPTILTGFFLPDTNIHAPNERFLAEYVPLGTAAARALFQELAALPPKRF